jgi:hypothetical protein
MALNGISNQTSSSKFDQQSLALGALFDEDYYLLSYPDIRKAGLDPLEHYLNFGWREGRDPSFSFSTTFYLKTYPDVRLAGFCPLVHYVLFGAAEGRLPTEIPETDPVRRRVKELFDPVFYSARYPELHGDLLEHYLTYGWLEGRDPNSSFETNFYLEEYPDVRATGICPLVHYVASGANEGRTTKGPRPSVVAINNSTPLRERAKIWKRPFEESSLISEKPDALIECLTRAEGGIILSISHDDYRTTWGGIQNCVCNEEAAFNRAGWEYVHIRPEQPIPMMADPVAGSEACVRVKLNGKDVGTSSILDLVSGLAGIKKLKVPRYAVVHHLLGYAPELLIGLLQSFSPEEVIFWLHDFFTICPSYNLLRNDVAFCGAPHPNSNACTVCSYGGERQTHLSRIHHLFEALSPTVLCPSDCAQNFWLAHSTLPYARILTVPHGQLLMPLGLPSKVRELASPLRIGFIGPAAFHKGWFVFEALATRHYGDSRYQFFHLGTERANLCRNISTIYARVNWQILHGMADIVAANELDVIVSWSLWPETFCFTVHEAVAGGAFVVARRGAGHTWPAIASLEPACGCALDTEKDLFSLFESGSILHMIPPKRYGYFEYNSGTADHVLGKNKDA